MRSGEAVTCPWQRFLKESAAILPMGIFGRRNAIRPAHGEQSGHERRAFAISAERGRLRRNRRGGSGDVAWPLVPERVRPPQSAGRYRDGAFGHCAARAALFRSHSGAGSGPVGNGSHDRRTSRRSRPRRRQWSLRALVEPHPGDGLRHIGGGGSDPGDCLGAARVGLRIRALRPARPARDPDLRRDHGDRGWRQPDREGRRHHRHAGCESARNRRRHRFYLARHPTGFDRSGRYAPAASPEEDDRPRRHRRGRGRHSGTRAAQRNRPAPAGTILSPTRQHSGRRRRYRLRRCRRGWPGHRCDPPMASSAQVELSYSEADLRAIGTLPVEDRLRFFG
jgi:hypothetical protein